MSRFSTVAALGIAGVAGLVWWQRQEDEAKSGAAPVDAAIEPGETTVEDAVVDTIADASTLSEEEKYTPGVAKAFQGQEAHKGQCFPLSGGTYYGLQYGVKKDWQAYKKCNDAVKTNTNFYYEYVPEGQSNVHCAVFPLVFRPGNLVAAPCSVRQGHPDPRSLPTGYQVHQAH